MSCWYCEMIQKFNLLLNMLLQFIVWFVLSSLFAQVEIKPLYISHFNDPADWKD